MEIGIDDYEKYGIIEIEIIPVAIKKKKRKKFIDLNREDKPYCHIYINNDTQDIDSNHIVQEDEVFVIKIILDYKFDHFWYLFSECDAIEEINVIKFNRKNIDTLGYMFYKCPFLTKVP